MPAAPEVLSVLCAVQASPAFDRAYRLTVEDPPITNRSGCIAKGHPDPASVSTWVADQLAAKTDSYALIMPQLVPAETRSDVPAFATAPPKACCVDPTSSCWNASVEPDTV
jgi:hypothetical protein